jgi:hypothetical protein
MDAYQKFVAAMNNLPIALRPVYTGDPNKPIVLYEGLLELQQTFTIDQEIKEHIETGSGHVVLTWFPLPCIKFEFANNHLEFLPDLHQPIYLRLSELNVSVPIRLSNFNLGGKVDNKVSGRIKEPIVQGLGQDLSCVMFHVANLSNFSGNCKIRLNETEPGWRADRVNFELVDELRANGGFAITHIGKLERLNSGVFSHVEAKEILDIFQNFLSFARGFRVPIILLTGYDAHGEKIWEYWDLSRGDSWQGVSSLLPELNAEGQFLADVFPDFLRWWKHSRWEKSVKFILHCYLEANTGAGGAEGAIVLGQTALELIAYILESSERTAADNIRKILTKFNISKNVPPSSDTENSSLANSSSSFTQDLEALEKHSFPPSIPILENLRQVIEEKNSRAEQENQKWEDGPRALTGIRNDIAHAKKDLDFLDEAQTSEARWDASDLGLWYLDVVLLNLFQYQGDYINRLNGRIESVPRTLE